MTNNKQWQLILLYIKYCYKISSKDNNDEEHVMHSKSGKIKIMIRYTNNLEKLLKGSEFVLNYVQLLYYKCHKINPNCGVSYIGSPDWIKNKKTTINSINKKDNKWF